MFRIQKILLAEYQEIYEPVLVESPFTEVTEDGLGIRQVQLGLTPTKILVGVDVFENNSSYLLPHVCLLEKDPEIECFELLFWNTWRERIATLKQIGPNLFNLTGSSPFSSTDVIPDEEEVEVSIHPTPRSYSLSDNDSARLPLKGASSFYKKYSSKYTDLIEKTSTISLSDDNDNHQVELQTYYQSLSVTNSISCGCNTSW